MHITESQKQIYSLINNEQPHVTSAIDTLLILLSKFTGDTIEDLKALFPGKYVLDVGCGVNRSTHPDFKPGLLVLAKTFGANTFGIDIMEPEKSDQRLGIRQGDIRAMMETGFATAIKDIFGRRQFDLVCATSILHPNAAPGIPNTQEFRRKFIEQAETVVSRDGKLFIWP